MITIPRALLEQALPLQMSLRDYFAAKAMQAFLVNPLPSKETAEKFKGFTVAEFISTRSYEMADEMLKAREL